MAIAAIYCRSSKDRAEVGLAAQRTELRAFAKAKGLTVVAEFSDMEVSGSLDETSRPGLRKLLAALADPARQWDTILALDTSRIARDPMLGLYVTREAEKHGVALFYAKMPVDGTSAFGETMLSVVRAFDRLHTRLSAEKGRGGLAANVAQGFRAGGAAPFGYRLQHTETGATRGGAPVRKSKLVVDTAPAKKAAAFLKARADGVARSEAARRASLERKPVASLIAIERNALTYAGFSVWNQRRKVKPTREDPRKTMEWRLREEWIISEKPTHSALITRSEAERILALHGEFKKQAPRVREPDRFILSGLLFTPDGKQWHGDAHDHAYRAGVKGQRINAPFIEGEILYHVAADFVDRAFLTKVIAEARRMASGIEVDPIEIDSEIRRTEKRLGNLLELAAESGDKALLAKIRESETALTGLREQKAAWVERKWLKEQLLAIKESDLRRVLGANALKLRGEDELTLEMIGYSEKERMGREELRRVLSTLVERIDLDPKTRRFEIRYRLPVTGVPFRADR
jgi:DNA invertase Pin-like site-specific DNA recombinase